MTRAGLPLGVKPSYCSQSFKGEYQVTFSAVKAIISKIYMCQDYSQPHCNVKHLFVLVINTPITYNNSHCMYLWTKHTGSLLNWMWFTHWEERTQKPFIPKGTVFPFTASLDWTLKIWFLFFQKWAWVSKPVPWRRRGKTGGGGLCTSEYDHISIFSLHSNFD